MEISALASGSSGNCFFVRNGKENGILVDAGISARRIAEELSKLDFSPNKIKGIFVTHEHSDHIKGIDVLARNFQIPVFATHKTVRNCFLCSDESLINPIKNNETLKIAGLQVEAFSKSHKAEDPVSYSIISSESKRLSIITDVGHACKNVVENVSESNFLCIESNYDEKMLINGPYPWFLKNWIKSEIGHLSNLQCSLCVLEHGNKKLKNVMLSHLSQNNNTPQLALNTFQSLIKERYDLKPKVTVSDRDVATELIKV